MIDELKAVNYVLRKLGNGKVSSLEGGDEDVLLSRDALYDAKRAILMRGWWFNKLSDMPVAKTTDDTFTLTNDMLAMYDLPDGLQLMGKSLYDTENATFVLTSFSDITATIVYDQPWESLPEEAYLAIVTLAAQELFDDLDGEAKRVGRLAAAHDKAMGALRAKQLLSKPINRLNSTSASSRLSLMRP